jgi:hypothetical protein
MYRTFFVQGLLEENRNRADPLFSYLIRPEYRSSASRFENALVRLLPNLKELYEGVRAVSETDSSVWPDKNEFFLLRTDVDTLFHRYIDFLNQYCLFEPEYEEPVILPPAEKTYVLFPEVIQDFPRFTKAFEKDRGTLQKVPLPREKESSPILWKYENSFLELRSILVQIGKLLDKGSKEHELAVSFPAVWEYRDILFELGKTLGVPLRIQQGMPLTEQPGGTWLQKVEQVVSARFAVSEVKEFLLDQAYPWKHRQEWRWIVQRGLRGNCHSLRDWEKVFSPGEEEGELAAVWNRFVEAIWFIHGSKTPKQLLGAAHRFSQQFFDEEAWNPVVLPVFQMSLEVIREIAETLGENGSITPFPLALSLMKNRIYVPQQKEGGVRVFPYRVAAGAPIRNHWIVQCSQGNTQVRNAPFEWIREDIKEALHLKGSDLSQQFLELYAVSGEEVGFSYSIESRSGAQLPAGWFVASGYVKPAEDREEAKTLDPLEIEKEHWMFSKESTGWKECNTGSRWIPLPYQQEGALRYLERSRGERLDITRQNLRSERIRKAILDQISPEGIPTFSPTGLECFALCPLQFLFEKVLGLKEELFDLWFQDFALEGSVFHEAFRLFYRNIQGGAGFLCREDREKYLDLIPEVVKGALFLPALREKRPFLPVLKALEQELQEKIAAFIEVELQEFEGWRIAALEQEGTYQEGEVALRGRIDRISESPGKEGFCLVDYKTGRVVGKKKLKAAVRGEDPQYPFYQIPSYVLLAESLGFPILRAAYYLVKGSTYQVVFGEGANLSEDDRELSLERVKKALVETAAKVKSGSFHGSAQDCSYCSFRSLCRRKYHVK